MTKMGHNGKRTNPLPVDLAIRRSGRRRLALSLFVALGGSLFSLSLGWLLWTQEQELTRVQFRLDAGKRIESLQRTVADRMSIVSSVAAFYEGSKLVERNEFHTFVGHVLNRRSDIQTMAWVPRIPGAQRQTHEQEVRKEGLASYAVSQRDSRGALVPAGQRDVHYPILFVEPPRTNQALVGLDLGSSPECLAAFRQAADINGPVAFVGPPLNDDETDARLLYVVEPAWNENQPSTQRPADQRNSDGFVLGIFRIGTLVEDALAVFPPVGINLFVATTSADGKEVPVYTQLSRLYASKEPRQSANAPSAPPSSPIHMVGYVDVANTRWTVDCVPLPAYLARYRTWASTETFLAGFIVTGLLVGYLLLLTGRTARVEKLVAERTHALAESEQRFRRLVDNAGDAFFLHDQQGKILDVSQRACDSLGYTRQDLLLMNIADFDVDYGPRNLEDYSKRPAAEYPVTFEAVHRRKDGTTFPVEIRLAPLDIGSQRLMLGLARDITDRKRAEQSLHAEQRLLRDMLDLHEQERKLVAYEIHDGLAQQLTAAIYKFQSVHQLHERDPEAAEELCDDAISLLRKAMAETRRLISGLRPPVLDEAGVVAAIDYLIAEQSRQGGPEIEFIHPTDINRFAAPLESAVFRIVQESLTNACRYSQSKKVHVELAQADGHVRIDVQDWGVGFDLANVKGDHVGLRGIRERAQLLGGTIVVHTAPQQGTHITVELPLVPQIENGANGTNGN